MGKVIKLQVVKKAKASGRNIAESERKTERVVLRLPPEVAEDLRWRAGSLEMPVSTYIATLLRTMQENPTATAEMLLEDVRGPF